MEGIDTAIQKIIDLANEAHSNQPPERVVVNADAAHITRLYNSKSGEINSIVSDAHPRHYKAGSLDATAKLVREFLDRPIDNKARMILVFVQAGRVEAVLDELGDRRERVSMAFQTSPAFKAVSSLTSRPAMDQKQLIDLLRTDIAGEYSPSNILATVRKIKFTSTSEGDSTITTGKASMGKRVEAEVAGLDGTALDSLEKLLITVPVYSDLLDNKGQPVKATVECHLDVDIAEQKFRLRTKAGEIERVLLETDRRIMDDLGFDAPPVAATTTTGRVLIVRGVPN